MRHLKMLTVAAMAVFALAVLVGAEMASATRLCSTNSTPCSSVYPSGTTINASSFGSVTLTTSGGFINPTISCSTSDMSVKTTSSGGGSGFAVNTAFQAVNFNGCTSSGATCNSSATVANGRVTNLGGSGTLFYASPMDGNLQTWSPVVHFTCTAFGITVECYFGSNSITGWVTGGNPANIQFLSETLFTQSTFPHSSSSGCPTLADWTGTYRATSPTSIWVSDS